ncbi:hypothetical protein PS6_003979 [Mucor atramentarius]
MSSTPTSAASATQSTLKPNDYNKGLDQEHITKLTQDAYRHFTEYTKAELKTIFQCVMYSDGRGLPAIRKDEYNYAGKIYTDE